MRNFRVTTLCFVCLIGQLEAVPLLDLDFWQSPSAWNDKPSCMRTNEPCDKAVKHYRSSAQGSDVIYSTETAICGCPSGNTCPTGYLSGGPKTISFKDTANRVSISLHYCDPIANDTQCSSNDIAMVMEGGTIPEVIRTVHCRCPADRPMKVKKSYFQGWKNVKELVCALPQCEINRSNGSPICQHVTRIRNPTTWVQRYSTTNLCECPRNYACVQDSVRRNEFYGTCQRIRT